MEKNNTTATEPAPPLKLKFCNPLSADSSKIAAIPPPLYQVCKNYDNMTIGVSESCSFIHFQWLKGLYEMKSPYQISLMEFAKIAAELLITNSIKDDWKGLLYIPLSILHKWCLLWFCSDSSYCSYLTLYLTHLCGGFCEWVGLGFQNFIVLLLVVFQLTFTCSKSTIKTLEKDAKYIQS